MMDAGVDVGSCRSRLLRLPPVRPASCMVRTQPLSDRSVSDEEANVIRAAKRWRRPLTRRVARLVVHLAAIRRQHEGADVVPNDGELGALRVVATFHIEAVPVFAKRVPDWKCVTTRHGIKAARALRV